MTLAKQARAVERDIFGALIGTLIALVGCRLAVFVVDIHLYFLVFALLVGAWSGAFVAHLGVTRWGSAVTSMRSFADGFRAICLRTILWLLGVAAVLGVLAVLTGSFDVVGRVAATAAVTAFASCCLWPFLSYFDEDKNWRVGLFGTVSVMAAYLLGMPSIWELGYRPGESALSGLTVALMMPVGIVAMTLTHSRATWTAGFLTTLIYAAATTLFLLAIWDADHWRSSERLAMSALTVLGFGAFAIACSIHAGMSDGRFWRWIGVAAAILAAGLTLVGIWQRTSGGEDTIVIIASVAAVIGHANLALLAPLRPGQSWWRYATIATGICTAIALDIDLLAAMGTNRHGITITGRIALASGILWSTGTLGLLILTRLNRSPVAISPDAPLLSIDLRCPRCGKRQVVAVGNSRCSDCDLGFHIALDSTTKLTEMAESGNQGDHDLQNLAESHHAES